MMMIRCWTQVLAKPLATRSSYAAAAPWRPLVASTGMPFSTRRVEHKKEGVPYVPQNSSLSERDQIVLQAYAKGHWIMEHGIQPDVVPHNKDALLHALSSTNQGLNPTDEMDESDAIETGKTSQYLDWLRHMANGGGQQKM